jgi:hypothetical protein
VSALSDSKQAGMCYVPVTVQELEIPCGDRETVRFSQVSETGDDNSGKSAPHSPSVFCVREDKIVPSPRSIGPRRRNLSVETRTPLIKTTAFRLLVDIKANFAHKTSVRLSNTKYYLDVLACQGESKSKSFLKAGGLTL